MKKSILVLSTLFYFYIGNILSPAVSVENRDSMDGYNNILQFIGKKEYDQAIEKLKALIKKDPQFHRAYKKIAEVYKYKKDIDTAITYFDNLKKINDRNAYVYYGLGLCYENKEQYEKAIENYKQSIEIKPKFADAYGYRGGVVDAYLKNQANKDRIKEVEFYLKELIQKDISNDAAYYGLGYLYQKTYKNKAGLSMLNKAIELNPDIWQAYHSKDIIYWNTNKFKEEINVLNTELELARKMKDLELEGIVLGNIGPVYRLMNDYQKALEYYDRSIKIHRQTGDKMTEGVVLGNIGSIYFNIDNYEKALAFYNQALKIQREVGSKKYEALNLLNIGTVYSSINKYKQALVYSDQALKISRELGDKGIEASALTNIGIIYKNLCRYQKALEFYYQALNVHREIGEKMYESHVLVNIGNIYFDVCNYEKALTFYNQALKIHRKIGNKRGEEGTLGNIGNIYALIGNLEDALTYYEKALKIAREIGDSRGEGIVLRNMGSFYKKLCQYDKAMGFFKKAYAIHKEMGAKKWEARELNSIGSINAALKKYPKSLDNHFMALKIGEKIRDHETIYWSQYQLGISYSLQKDFDKSLHYFKKAIHNLESIRWKLKIKEMKVDFIVSKMSIYEDMINLLFILHKKDPSKNYDKECLLYTEKAKARAFLDSLHEAKIDLKRDVSPKLAEEENKITSKISYLQTRLIKPKLIEAERQELKKELERLEDQYQRLIFRIKEGNPEYAKIAFPEPIQLEKIQRDLLPEKTAIIEYFVGEENIYMFFITRKDFSVHKLSNSKNINERTRNYIKLLSDNTKKNFFGLAAGKKLFNELVGPVQKKLKKVNRLIIVPDGNLHYLPFEALINSSKKNQNRFLIEDYKMSYAPSSSSLINILSRKRKAESNKEFLAFADPVYDIEKPSSKGLAETNIFREYSVQMGFNFKRLSFSGEEVKKISRYFPKKMYKIYMREKAKEENLKEVDIDKYNIIHFATHGFLDEKNSIRSSLIFTLDNDPKEDGFFQVREIYNMRLNADLVVLSACNSGKGKLERGEGVLGLYRAFLNAGAQSVVMSLWNINDRATSDFMWYLYKNLSKGMTKEGALQKAKIKMIYSKFSHPFYWAAFVLSGESNSTIRSIHHK